MEKKKIAHIWQGVTEHFNKWEDGIRMAYKVLEDEYDISFIEPWDNLDGYDVLIYHEAPCTINGENAQHYLNVKNHPTKKILLFAGGPIDARWVEGFDVICVESKINKEEFAAIGIDTITAFGINDKLMKPMNLVKEFTGVHHGTCASWKRQQLVAEAFGNMALIIGRRQKHDTYPFDRAFELGATIKEELKGKELVRALNTADVLVQSSDFWGGGQRATLEAMACGLPVICMEDSPKNREYVEESGAGVVCSPDTESIRTAYKVICEDYDGHAKRGMEYVKNKWTHVHYALALKQAIKRCLA